MRTGHIPVDHYPHPDRVRACLPISLPETFQHTGVDQRIIVDKDCDLTARGQQASIAGVGYAVFWLRETLHTPDLARLLSLRLADAQIGIDGVQRAIPRAIINDDDLKIPIGKGL